MFTKAFALGPALLWLALLPACQAQAPTYSQDYAALSRAVGDNFYDAKFGGLDWPRVQAEYARRVQAAQNDAQFLALMNEMLARLHASHTRLYGPDDFEFYLLPEIMRGRISARQESGRRLYQIGCLSAPDDPARVAAVLDGSPAAGAGLRAGDVLVSVDGRPYHGLTQFGAAPARLVYRRQGAETAVTVTPASPSPLDLMLTATEKSARVIPQPDGRKIGYVHLWCMGNSQFQRTLEELLLGRLHDTDGLVLDLRQGFGGTPFGFADPFFRPDIRVSSRTRKAPSWSDRNGGYSKPLVVLVDHGTRSAKEWLAYTLQQSKRATLVGQRTAGAELALQIFPVGPGFLLELAVQDLALNGVRLEGRGVDPDVVLPGAPSDDAYLQEAMQILAQKRARPSGPRPAATALIQKQLQKQMGKHIT